MKLCCCVLSCFLFFGQDINQLFRDMMMTAWMILTFIGFATASPQIRKSFNNIDPGEEPLREISYCEEQYGLQLYPHPKYCDQFYKCANGTLSIETCENGLLFGGKGAVYNHCDYHWAVNCKGRIADIPEIGRQQSGGCRYRFGIFPRSDYCDTSFFRCKFGTREDVPCTKGLAYDDRIHQCNWPDLTPGCNPEEIVRFQCPDKLPSGSFARKFLPFPRFASDDCYSLIVCVNGYPRRVGCEKGKVFDEVTLSCEHPENVRGRCAGQPAL